MHIFRFVVSAGVLLCAVAFLVLHNLSLNGWTIDDAFISFRYAENFAAGHGLVFNEGERVEGYTTFLWVFLLGMTNWLGVETEPAARALGLLFSAGCLLLTTLSHRFIANTTPRTASTATLLLATCGAFVVWAMGMMEVPLGAFTILFAVLCMMRAEWAPRPHLWVVLSAIAAVLATMTRPEFGLIYGVLFLHRAALDWKQKRWLFLLYGVVFVALYAPYFYWRYTYYGYLLPNTFYAKVGATGAQLLRGVRYVHEFIGPTWLLLVPIIGLAAFRRESIRLYRPEGLLLAILGLHLIYVVAVGGDVMAAFRFFAPLMPLYCLAAALALAWLCASRLRYAMLLVAILAYNLTQTYTHPRLVDSLHGEYVTPRGALVGKWMKEWLQSDAVIATNTAGTIPYYSGLKTVDMLGLNDAHIAHVDVPDMGSGTAGHEKGDGLYVLSRNPDYIQLGSSLGTRTPRFRGDVEIFQSPDFYRLYVLREFPLPNGELLTIYEHRDAILKRKHGYEGAHFSARIAPTLHHESVLRVREHNYGFHSMLGNFEAEDTAWSAQGDAFALLPVTTQYNNQQTVQNYLGRGYLNSYHPELDDRAQGTATSPAFEVPPDTVLFFLIAGGMEGAGVRIQIDGETIATYHGTNSEIFRGEVQELHQYAGRQLLVQVFDESAGNWGHTLADHFALFAQLP